jgi:hypothetical protein
MTFLGPDTELFRLAAERRLQQSELSAARLSEAAHGRALAGLEALASMPSRVSSRCRLATRHFTWDHVDSLRVDPNSLSSVGDMHVRPKSCMLACLSISTTAVRVRTGPWDEAAAHRTAQHAVDMRAGSCARCASAPCHQSTCSRCTWPRHTTRSSSLSRRASRRCLRASCRGARGGSARTRSARSTCTVTTTTRKGAQQLRSSGHGIGHESAVAVAASS